MLSRHRPALILWLSAAMLPPFLACLSAVALPAAWSTALAPSAASAWLALMLFLAIALAPAQAALLASPTWRSAGALSAAALALAIPGAALALHASLTPAAQAAPALLYLAVVAGLAGGLGRFGRRKGIAAGALAARGLIAAGALVIFVPFLLWMRAALIDDPGPGSYWPGLALSALTEDGGASRPWLGLLALGLAGAAVLAWEGRRRVVSLVAAASCLAGLLASAPSAQAQAGPPVRILALQPLLGSRVRAGVPAPLQVRLARAQAGDWRGELAARVGERRYAVAVVVPGSSLASPAVVELAPIFQGRESLVFEARDARGPTRLAMPPWEPELLEDDRALCVYLGPESRGLAEQALGSRPGFAPPVLIKRDRLSALGRAGDAVDAVFVARPRPSDLPALRAFAARGGAVVFQSALAADSGLIPEGAASVRRLGRGIFLGPAFNPRLLKLIEAVRRLGQGIFLGPGRRAAPASWLDDVMVLLTQRFASRGRGRLRDAGLARALASAPFSGDARLGWRALAGVILTYLVLLGALLGLTREASDARRIPGAVLALAVTALATTLALSWLVLSPATAVAERWRIEDRAAGSDLAAVTTYLRLRSLRGANRTRVPLLTAGPVAPWFSGPTAAARCRDELSFDGEGAVLALDLEAGSGRVLRWTDVGRRRQGAILQVSRDREGALVLTNAGDVPVREVLVVRGDQGAWIGELEPGATQEVPPGELLWHELVDERVAQPHRRLLTQAIARRLRRSGPGGLIIGTIVDPQPATAGPEFEERSLGRALALTWLDAELE